MCLQSSSTLTQLLLDLASFLRNPLRQSVRLYIMLGLLLMFWWPIQALRCSMSLLLGCSSSWNWHVVALAFILNQASCLGDLGWEWRRRMSLPLKPGWAGKVGWEGKAGWADLEGEEEWQKALRLSSNLLSMTAFLSIFLWSSKQRCRSLEALLGCRPQWNELFTKYYELSAYLTPYAGPIKLIPDTLYVIYVLISSAHSYCHPNPTIVMTGQRVDSGAHMWVRVWAASMSAYNRRIVAAAVQYKDHVVWHWSISRMLLIGS